MLSHPCPTCGRAWSSRSEAIISHGRTMVFSGGRWRREELVVMEAFIGQPLPEGAKVKHINSDTMDNRLENLFLEVPGEPSLFRRVNDEIRVCVVCDDHFLIHPEKTGDRARFCSRRCYETLRSDKRSRGMRRCPAKVDPDRWRRWTPEIAWAARMIPDPDPGPGGPNRYPVITVPAPA